MYKVQKTSIVSDEKQHTNHVYEFQIGQNYSSTDRDIYDVQEYWSEKYPSEQFEGFDQWRLLLSREEEFNYCKWLIQSAIKEKRKIHISNITCRETVEYISTYYKQCGYFIDYPRKCSIPYDTTLITISIAITSLCYSEKQKNKTPYKEVSIYTPIRSSSDQKHLTTMMRTGVITQVDIQKTGTNCLQELLQEEVFSPFLLGQISLYAFQKNNMSPENIYTIQISI